MKQKSAASQPAGQLAGSNGHFGLYGLHSLSGRIQSGIQENQNTVFLIFIQKFEPYRGNRSNTDTNHTKQQFVIDPCNKNHAHKDNDQHQGCSQIRLYDNKHKGNRQSQQDLCHTAEIIDSCLFFFGHNAGKGKNDGDLGKFRRLQLIRADGNPALGAPARLPFQFHCNQHGDNNPVKIYGQINNRMIIYADYHQHKHQSGNKPKDLQFDLPHIETAKYF